MAWHSMVRQPSRSEVESGKKILLLILIDILDSLINLQSKDSFSFYAFVAIHSSFASPSSFPGMVCEVDMLYMYSVRSGWVEDVIGLYGWSD